MPSANESRDAAGSTLGVAISGGGHRASLFGFGVMLYLADVGKLKDTVAISSVSGGSITNGYLSQLEGLAALDGESLLKKSAPFLRAMARRGTLFGWWGTWVYVATVISLVAVNLVTWVGLAKGAWEPGCLKGSLLVVSLVFLFLCVFRCRGWIAARAFDAVVFRNFRRSARAVKLREMAHAIPEHVICATDLQSGEHVYLTGAYVYTDCLGLGEPGDLPLADAVQSSAAYPFGLPPRIFPIASMRFLPPAAAAGARAPLKTDKIVLTDGGVYDNMGDQWFLGLERRMTKRFVGKPGTAPVGLRAWKPRDLIVVNAGLNMKPERLWWARIPGLDEVAQLARAILVFYDNTTTARRRLIVDHFNRVPRDAGMGGIAERGVLVMIEQSPYRVPLEFERPTAELDPRAARVKAAIAALDESAADSQQGPREWSDRVARTSNVATTLRALGDGPTCELIYHAYVTAMTNAHVILDYPLPRIPRFTDFRDRILQAIESATT